MMLTPEALQAIDFEVSKLEVISEPWQTDGLIPTEMPPGIMVFLEPRIEVFISDHMLVGEIIEVRRNGGSPVTLQPYSGRRSEDGELSLFFAVDTDFRFEMSDQVKFVGEGFEI